MLGVDFVGVGCGGGDGVGGGFGVALNRLSAEPFYRTVLTLGPQGEFFAFDFRGGCHAGITVAAGPFAVIQVILCDG